jgi:hypothetical protein
MTSFPFVHLKNSQFLELGDIATGRPQKMQILRGDRVRSDLLNI